MVDFRYIIVNTLHKSEELSSSSSSLLSPLFWVFTIMHLKQTMFIGYTVLSCSVFTVCVTCNVISPVKYVLYFYISTFRSLCAVPNMAVLCSSGISCFPITCVVPVLSEWFCSGYSHPFFYRHQFCVHIPHVLNLYYEVFIFYNLLDFFVISVWYGNILSHVFSSRYFSWSSGDSQRSGFKLHTAVLSVLCVMFQVQLSFVVNLSNVFLV